MARAAIKAARAARYRTLCCSDVCHSYVLDHTLHSGFMLPSVRNNLNEVPLPDRVTVPDSPG